MRGWVFHMIELWSPARYYKQVASIMDLNKSASSRFSIIIVGSTVALMSAENETRRFKSCCTWETDVELLCLFMQVLINDFIPEEHSPKPFICHISRSENAMLVRKKLRSMEKLFSTFFRPSSSAFPAFFYPCGLR